MHALLAAAVLMQDPAISALSKAPPHPRTYGCPRANKPPVLNGNVDDKSWHSAPWTDEFMDIEGPQHKPQPWHSTRVKMLWDDKCLYIGAKMVGPQLWATLTKRDSVIFHDNDFEVFLDPDGDNHRYVELEINALNTVWDLLLPKPYRDGGPAVDAYDIKGLRTAVKLDGKLNDPAQKSKGWSVTIAIPWTALAGLSNEPLPPNKGQRMRINFSRVEWDLEVVDGKFRKIDKRPEHNWVWSPQWAINMHRPETWGYIEFQDKHAPVNPDPLWPQRCALMNLYYHQRAFREANNRYARLSELNIPFKGEMLVHENFWMATIHKGKSWISIDQDSRITVSRPARP